jgi:hypothetical protein
MAGCRSPYLPRMTVSRRGFRRGGAEKPHAPLDLLRMSANFAGLRDCDEPE